MGERALSAKSQDHLGEGGERSRSNEIRSSTQVRSLSECLDWVYALITSGQIRYSIGGNGSKFIDFRLEELALLASVALSASTLKRISITNGVLGAATLIIE